MLHSTCRPYRIYLNGHRTIVIRGRDIGVGCYRSRMGVREREARRHLVQRRDSPSPETPVDRASIRSLQLGQVGTARAPRRLSTGRRYVRCNWAK